MRDLAATGRARRARLRVAAAGSGSRLAALALLCARAVLLWHRARLWNRDLAALSPVAAAAQALDGQLRSELGAPDISNLVVVNGARPGGAAACRSRGDAARCALMADGIIGGYDSPARYLPSRGYAGRRDWQACPMRQTLARRGWRAATASSAAARAKHWRSSCSRWTAARSGAPLERSCAGCTPRWRWRVDALLWHHDGQWYALLPLRARNRRGPDAGDIDIARVRAALAGNPPGSVLAMNMKQETDALYGGYLREAVRLSLAGLRAPSCCCCAGAAQRARAWRA